MSVCLGDRRLATICRAVVFLEPERQSHKGKTLQDKAYTAASLVSPSHAEPIETRTFLFFLALLRCYCITHVNDPPGFVLVAVTV